MSVSDDLVINNKFIDKNLEKHEAIGGDKIL